MTLEKQGNEVSFNGYQTDWVKLSAVCRKYFSPESLERLRADLEAHGRVHVAVVFVDTSTLKQKKLSDANKKIAALESLAAKLTSENLLLKTKEAKE